MRPGAIAALILASAFLATPAPAAADTYMPVSFHDTVSAYPRQLFRVIIQGQPAVTPGRVQSDVEHERNLAPAHEDGIGIAYSSINAVAAELTGKQILLLFERKDILAITPDAPLRSVIANPPFALEPPTVTGLTESGSSLAATPGQWSGAQPLALRYQWKRCDPTGLACTDIAGATSPSYAASPDDIGSTLVAAVTATNDDGTASAVSVATAAVVAAPPVVQIAPPNAVAAPLVAGSAIAGETLSASDGVWGSGSMLTLTRQWQRCSPLGDACLDVPGATDPTYLLGPDDIGATLRIVVTATDAFGTATAASASTEPVAAAPTPPPDPTTTTDTTATTPDPTATTPDTTTTTTTTTPDPPPELPTIAGTAQQGEQLDAAGGEEYHWQRCNPVGDVCADITDANTSTYVPTADDVGSTLRVVAGALASAPTDVVLPALPTNVTPPTIHGALVSGSQLDAFTGDWSSAAPLTYAYLWQRCNTTSGVCVDVATTPTYLAQEADAGLTLRVVVSATNDGGSVTARSVTTDRIAPTSPSGFWSWQLGPYAAGVDAQWTAVANAGDRPPAIAIVDSGVDDTLPGLGGAVVQSATLTSLPQSAGADSYGHGSFVAEVAAGHAPGEAGAAPTAPIVSLDVMDDNGMALTSDVIAAADWIYTHKNESRIRVANFSLVGSANSTFQYDPLDRALERLWLSGVVVVTAAGNYGNGVAGDVALAPANDPFVITVGASDTLGTLDKNDDLAAPWSVFGHTYDGFAKPELAAPGRYIVAPVPTDSTLYRTRTDRIVAPGRLQLSGTSFAAPLVAGVAADLLALHPQWTPDQVKGALMWSAAPAPASTPLSVGVGLLDATAALTVNDPPNPNAALDEFVVSDPTGISTPVFDTASWGTAVQANASWGTASWGTASWGTASWGTASWGTASWGTAYWSSASWGTASWGTASWGTASWGTDLATSDANAAGSYWMSWPH
jgi:serine protease AprX